MTFSKICCPTHTFSKACCPTHGHQDLLTCFLHGLVQGYFYKNYHKNYAFEPKTRQNKINIKIFFHQKNQYFKSSKKSRKLSIEHQKNQYEILIFCILKKSIPKHRKILILINRRCSGCFTSFSVHRLGGGFPTANLGIPQKFTPLSLPFLGWGGVRVLRPTLVERGSRPFPVSVFGSGFSSQSPSLQTLRSPLCATKRIYKSELQPFSCFSLRQPFCNIYKFEF